MKVRLISIAIIGLLVLPGGATAATNSISLNEVSPTYQGVVTFTISLAEKRLDCYGYAHNTCARVEVLCYQGSDLVYGEPGDLEQAREFGFVLGGGSSEWVSRGGGSADCVANLFVFDKVRGQQTYVLLASTSFAASG